MPTNLWYFQAASCVLKSIAGAKGARTDATIGKVAPPSPCILSFAAASEAICVKS